MKYFENACVIAGGVISVLIWCLYLYFTRTFTHWKKKGVIFKLPVPIFGNYLRSFLRQKLSGFILQEIYNAYPKERFVGTFKAATPVLVVRDPDLIKQILVKDFQHFYDRPVNAGQISEDIRVSQPLGNLPGSQWKDLRRKLTPAFSSGKLRSMFDLFVSCGNDFETSLSKLKDSVEMRDLSARYVTQITSSIIFGIETNTLSDPNLKFREMGKKLLEPSIGKDLNFYMSSLAPHLKKFVSLQSTPKYVMGFFIDAINEVITSRKENNLKRNDMLQMIIELQEKECISSKSNREDSALTFTNNYLTAPFMLFIAGFETTSTVMSFMWYELALNPDIQTRVQEEIDNVLQEHDGRLTYEAVQKLTYLDQVLSESLRKHPSSAMVWRVCTSPYTIPGTDILLNKNDQIEIPIYALHHDPQYFPNPSKFDPERFSEEGKKTIHPFTYLPFGDGPRNCIALRFTRLLMMVGLVSVLKKFTISPCSKTEIPIKYTKRGLLLQDANGIWLQIRNRRC